MKKWRRKIFRHKNGTFLVLTRHMSGIPCLCQAQKCIWLKVSDEIPPIWRQKRPLIEGFSFPSKSSYFYILQTACEDCLCWAKCAGNQFAYCMRGMCCWIVLKRVAVSLRYAAHNRSPDNAKHHVKNSTFSNLQKTSTCMSSTSIFGRPFIRIFKPSIFLNSARIKDSSHMHYMCQKYALRETENFSSSFFYGRWKEFFKNPLQI